VDFQRHLQGEDDENLLIRADKTPNARGAVEAGVKPSEGGLDFAGIIKAIREGSIKAAYVTDDSIAHDPEIAQAIGRLDFLVAHACVETELTRQADVVFPAATYAEKNGTFTNFQGRVQRIRPAVALLDADRALDGFAASRLDKFGSQFDRWNRGPKRDARPAWRIVAGIASLMGGRFRYQSAEDVFTDLATNVEAFKGMSYRKIGNKGMMLASAVPAGVPVASSSL
jgi:NADH-quinone oxidoreductase subunit G